MLLKYEPANGNGETASKEGAKKLGHNTLYKHLFRKNEGCGALSYKSIMMFSLKKDRYSHLHQE